MKQNIILKKINLIILIVFYKLQIIKFLPSLLFPLWFKSTRQKGFLTPIFEFNIGDDAGIIAPIPLKKETEIIFKPKVIIDNDFNYFDKYTLNTIINHKSAG